MNEVNWIGFQDSLLSNYQKFARYNYGKKAYQAKENYINWLYKENPLSVIKEDFLVGISNQRKTVVGCIHKMRMHWRYESKVISVPAFHNLMVDKEYRYGTGFILVMAATKNENYALMPGVIQPFTEFYNTLKYQKVSAMWYRKFIKPLSGSIAFFQNKLFNYSTKENYFYDSKLNGISTQNFKTIISPSDDLLEQLVDVLNVNNTKICSPYWTIEQLRWRFFHPLGPKHMLIYENFSETIKNFAILSMGPRHGMNMCRILLLESVSAKSLELLLSAIFSVIKKNGGHIVHLFCADKMMNNKLKEVNWNPMENSPDTYFFHKDKKNTFKHYSFTGGSGDFGFEAIV